MEQTPSGSAPTLDDVPAAVERQLNAFLNQVSPPVAEIGAPVAKWTAAATSIVFFSSGEMEL